MSIIPLLLFCVSCNFDNFVIGISYGIRKITVNTKAKIIIALPTLLGTYLSLSMGRAFFSLLPLHSANIISCCILLIIGLYTILKVIKKRKNLDSNILVTAEMAKKYDTDNNGNIDAKEAFVLGLVLALNNIGLGIGFSTSNHNILITAVITSFLSAIGFNIGNSLGKKCFSKLLNNYTEFISGLLIITLGIIELFL